MESLIGSDKREAPRLSTDMYVRMCLAAGDVIDIVLPPAALPVIWNICYNL